jgi:hypothetical protein
MWKNFVYMYIIKLQTRIGGVNLVSKAIFTKATATLAVLAIGIASFGSFSFGERNVQALGSNFSVEGQQIQYLQPPSFDPFTFNTRVKVKGIYVSAWTISSTSGLNRFVDITNSTEINAWVTDIKEEKGEVSYLSKVPTAVNHKTFDVNGTVKVKDMQAIVDELNANGIYTIGRIVCFKDPKLANQRPDLAIRTKSGALWRDRTGASWLDPYNKDNWEYLLELAEEAADMGFREIQFDYVRFPTDGDRSTIDYGPIAKEKTMSQNINEFLSYATQRLHKRGVYTSADIFGQVTTNTDDMQLGQHLETIAPTVDYLSPMMYPSHYFPGVYGVEHPDLKPYDIIYRGLKGGVERLEKMENKEQLAAFRPWLQDFTAPWIKPYQVYGAKQVREQIQAVYDVGVEEWILWSAGNRYSIDGLLPAKKNDN